MKPHPEQNVIRKIPVGLDGSEFSAVALAIG